MKTLAEGREIIADLSEQVGKLPGEVIRSVDAVGRVLAEPLYAKLSSPNFHAAAMDGIAVAADQTYGANEIRPMDLQIGKDAFYVNTGQVLPPETDAVIMIEQVQKTDENHVRIEAPAFPWQYVRKMGEDIVRTELLFPRNHILTPYCIGALLSGGVFSVSVRRKPRVMIIPTGSELVDWQDLDGKSPEPGQVIDSNSHVLGQLVRACGGTYERHEKVSDDLNRIEKAIIDAVTGDCDIVLTVGGSSAGSEDYAKDVIVQIGQVLLHGVTIMPGKPLIIGRVKNKPVFGIPGYPISAIVAFEQFVRPLISSMLGKPESMLSYWERPYVSAQPTRKIASKLGIEEFVRVKLGRVRDNIVATPMPRGAGSITSITEADGILRIPNHLEGINQNESVSVELLRPPTSIDNTIVIVGSHDNTLDVLADQLKAEYPHLTLSSSHVGSMGGLMAIKKGVCHMAGSHLLDLQDGTYNVSYIRKYLPDTPVKIIHLVLREQGLIVAPGNPKNIRDVSDLARKDILFINRQAGSGTRILLDFKLAGAGIDAADIRGYSSEEFTHMSIAAAVMSGAADVGLGIYAAAKALNLEFIPVVTEQYDLIVSEQVFESENIQCILNIIRGTAFKNRVLKLGGYHTEKTGQLVDY